MLRRLLSLLLLLPGLLQAETISESKPAPGTWTFNASHPLAQGMVAGYIAECGGVGGEDENIVTDGAVGPATMGSGMVCTADDAVHQNVFVCTGGSPRAIVADHPLLGGPTQDALSVYVLVRPDLTTNGSSQYLVSKDGSGDRGWWMARKTNQNLSTNWLDSGQTRSAAEVTDGILNTVWTSLVMTIDTSGAGGTGFGHSLEDGQTISSDTGDDTLTDLASTDHDITICNRNGGSAFLGKISTIYIYDRELSVAEIQSLHTDPWAMLSTVGGGPSTQILRRRRQ